MVPQEKKICPRLPLEIGTIDLYSMGEKVCLETVSSGQVDFKRHVKLTKTKRCEETRVTDAKAIM